LTQVCAPERPIRLPELGGGCPADRTYRVRAGQIPSPRGSSHRGRQRTGLRPQTGLLHRDIKPGRHHARRPGRRRRKTHPPSRFRHRPQCLWDRDTAPL